ATSLSFHGGRFDLFASGCASARSRSAIAATADRGVRGPRLSSDDRSGWRFRQRRLDRRAYQMRISDDRDPSECRLQVWPLARHCDAAAPARRWGEHAAAVARMKRSETREQTKVNWPRIS